jgi:AAA+ superfamily predicted ATPase
MKESEAISAASISNGDVYADSWEHLSDELAYLNLQIQKHWPKHPYSSSNSLEQLWGVALSDEEMNRLFRSLTVVPGSETSSGDMQDAEFNKGLRQAAARIDNRRAASLKAGIYLSLHNLAQIFNLTPFEEKCVVICLAPELDRRYEKIYAYLQDDITCKKPSVDLILKLLCSTIEERVAARAAFNPNASLLKFRLVQLSNGANDFPVPLLSRSLKVADRVVDFLLSTRRLDARLEGTARLVSPHPLVSTEPEFQKTHNHILSFIQWNFSDTTSAKPNLIFYLHGPAGSGKQKLVQSVCNDLTLPVVIGDVSRISNEGGNFTETVELLAREAVLQPAALCLENIECLFADDERSQSYLKSLSEAIQTYSRLTFLLGLRAWKPDPPLRGDTYIDLEFPVPDDRTRKQLWERHFDRLGCIPADLDFGDLASKFRFTPGQIHDAAQLAQDLARWRSPDNGKIEAADLYKACRFQSNQKLSTIARKIDSKFQWSDIVLPSDQMEQLKEICNQARFRNIVYADWGFDRKLSLGKGLTVLFSGPSGTGKTMAAEIIANELCLDLYKIDLSQVVSKYIGETEKNLDRIFSEAQTSNAILFFDEADALFGKRSEVKDAHDRYANIEIGYLLQRMEEYDGIAILATNLRQHMDEAFVRRIQMIIEFPFPDESFRCRIWKVMFPSETPISNDVDLDLLAREIKLPGGNIKNIAVAAAFHAAENSHMIRMKHLLHAARREYQKLGRIWNEMDRSHQSAGID